MDMLGQFRTSRSKRVGRYGFVPGRLGWFSSRVHRAVSGCIRYVSTGHRVGGAYADTHHTICSTGYRVTSA
eukprot:2911455-Rhodomonas_salina.2